MSFYGSATGNGYTQNTGGTFNATGVTLSFPDIYSAPFNCVGTFPGLVSFASSGTVTIGAGCTINTTDTTNSSKNFVDNGTIRFGSATTMSDLTINNGGVVNFGTTVTVGGNITINGGGILNAGTGTTTLTGTSDVTILGAYNASSTRVVSFASNNFYATNNISCIGSFPGLVNLAMTNANQSFTLGTGCAATLSGMTTTPVPLMVSGTLNLNGFPFTPSGGVTVSSTGTLRLQGNESVSTPTLNTGSTVEYYGSGIYNALKAGATYANLSFTGSGSWATSTNITVNGNFNQTAGTFTHTGTLTFAGTTGPSFATTSPGTLLKNVTVNVGAQTLTLVGSGLSLSGNLALTSGTLDASTNGCAGVSCPITLAGHWQGGTNLFVPRTSTVTLNGTNQQITGTSTFYNLTKTTATTDTLTFSANQTQTVTNTWTAQGAASNILSLRSSSTGTQWKINPQSTRTLSYLDVEDSNNTNSTPIATAGLHGTNSTNNTNWLFYGTPVVTPVTVTSSNASTTLAKVGDTVTVSFTSDQVALVTPTGTIGVHTATILNTGGNSWSASAALASGDTEGSITFSIIVGNTDGSATTTVSATTNASTVTFDKTAPTITLLGINPDTLVAGGSYSDPGANAQDTRDGTLTALITTTGTLDTTTAGTYTRTYTVSDTAGNATSTTRTITVTPAPVSVTNTLHAGGGFIVDSGGLAPSSASFKQLTARLQIIYPDGHIVYLNAPTATTGLTSSPSAEKISMSITKRLSFGMHDVQVLVLQQLLNHLGFSIATTGAGSLGHETTTFGPATRAAVIRFQKAHNIDPTGIVGPLTRGVLAGM